MTLFATQHPKHLQHFHYQFSQSLPKSVSLLLHAIIFQFPNAAHAALASWIHHYHHHHHHHHYSNNY